MTEIGQYFSQKKGGYIKPFFNRKNKKYSIKKSTLLVRNKDIVRFTFSKGKNKNIKIIEVLNKNPNQIDLEIIRTQFSLHNLKKFKQATQKELHTLLEIHDEFSPRPKINNRFIVTIDSETAKDLDDAVSVKKLKNGYELGVYIADVSLFVKKNSNLDKEAFKRGTSIYFGKEVIPMLPPLLSNDYCSLNTDKEKYVMAVQIFFDFKGNVKTYKIFPAIIKTNHRLSYDSVNKLLKFPNFSKLSTHVKTMDALRKILLKKRQASGSIYFNLDETKVNINAAGEVEKLYRKPRGKAEEIVEEFMLAANQIVAKFLDDNHIPTLYRIHSIPEEFKLIIFNEALASLHIKKLDISAIRPKSFQKLIFKTKEPKLKTIITYLILRTMQTAKYSIENEGHFGLGFSHYTHFTSPIRRYPDLIVHRLIKNVLLKNKKYLYNKKELALIAEHSTQKEKKATEIERAYMGLKQIRFIKKRIGHVYTGIISGTSENGIFVELTKYPIYGMIPFFLLRNDYYIFSKTENSYIGQNTGAIISLGTSVKVKLVKADLFRNFIDFELLQVLDK